MAKNQQRETEREYTATCGGVPINSVFPAVCSLCVHAVVSRSLALIFLLLLFFSCSDDHIQGVMNDDPTMMN